MRDDIDWFNASSDLGLVQLCREMAALAQPIEAMASFASSPARRKAARPLRGRSRASSAGAMHGPAVQ